MSCVRLRPGIWPSSLRIAGIGGLYLCSLLLSVSHAQDGTIKGGGLETKVVPIATPGSPDSTTYNITGGTRSKDGNNLFHSFFRFNVDPGDIADFQNYDANGMPGGTTSNILSRVTREISSEPSVSNINGTIQTTGFGSANLFLLNPDGILFGPGAKLNVGGSFHASTADFLRVNDERIFFDDREQISSLTMVDPSAFGFLEDGGPIGKIGVGEKGPLGETELAVLAGRTLSLVGGDVEITAGIMRALSGKINIAGVASAGEVLLDPNKSIEVQMDDFSELGVISLSEDSTLNVESTSSEAEGSGTVIIRGGRLFIHGSDINANSRYAFLDNATTGIDIKVKGDAQVIGTPGDEASLSANARILGRDAGDIFITAGDVLLDAATITSESSDGDSGDVVLDVNSLTLVNDAEIRTTTRSDKSTSLGGMVKVDAKDAVTIAAGSDNPAGSATAGRITTSTEADGKAGPIIIETPRLAMRDGGTIQATSTGAGGAGDIALDVDHLTVEGGAQIINQTTSTGTGGKVEVTAAGTIDLTGRSKALAMPSGIVSLTSGTKKAGSITLNATNLVIRDGAEVNAKTVGTGDAGSIALNATNLIVRGDAEVSAKTEGVGQGGDIRVNARNITLSDGGAITAASERSDQHAGAPGGISIEATDRFELANGGRVSVETTGANTSNIVGNIDVNATSLLIGSGAEITAKTKGAGQGGSITVNAQDITLSDGGSITAASESSDQQAGESGSIFITATDTFQLVNGGEVSVETARANAGSIEIEVGELVHLRNNSRIATSVANGEGNGGDIRIDPTFVVLQGGSAIVAQARAGSGGKITIVTDYLFKSVDSIIDASSETGIDGTVVITSPDADIVSGTLPLSSSFLDASALLASRCAARASPRGSSLVVSGCGGLPPGPDTFLPAYP
jgi:filamentous hemagglutinin family protein